MESFLHMFIYIVIIIIISFCSVRFGYFFFLLYFGRVNSFHFFFSASAGCLDVCFFFGPMPLCVCFIFLQKKRKKKKIRCRKYFQWKQKTFHEALMLCTFFPHSFLDNICRIDWQNTKNKKTKKFNLRNFL